MSCNNGKTPLSLFTHYRNLVRVLQQDHYSFCSMVILWSLPAEIALIVLSKLSMSDLKTCRTVCKRWYKHTTPYVMKSLQVCGDYSFKRFFDCMGINLDKNRDISQFTFLFDKKVTKALNITNFSGNYNRHLVINHELQINYADLFALLNSFPNTEVIRFSIKRSAIVNQYLKLMVNENACVMQISRLQYLNVPVSIGYFYNDTKRRFYAQIVYHHRDTITYLDINFKDHKTYKRLFPSATLYSFLARFPHLQNLCLATVCKESLDLLLVFESCSAIRTLKISQNTPTYTWDLEYLTVPVITTFREIDRFSSLTSLELTFDMFSKDNMFRFICNCLCNLYFLKICNAQPKCRSRSYFSLRWLQLYFDTFETVENGLSCTSLKSFQIEANIGLYLLPFLQNIHRYLPSIQILDIDESSLRPRNMINQISTQAPPKVILDFDLNLPLQRLVICCNGTSGHFYPTLATVYIHICLLDTMVDYWFVHKSARYRQDCYFVQKLNPQFRTTKKDILQIDIANVQKIVLCHKQWSWQQTVTFNRERNDAGILFS